MPKLQIHLSIFITNAGHAKKIDVHSNYLYVISWATFGRSWAAPGRLSGGSWATCGGSGLMRRADAKGWCEELMRGADARGCCEGRISKLNPPCVMRRPKVTLWAALGYLSFEQTSRRRCMKICMGEGHNKTHRHTPRSHFKNPSKIGTPQFFMFRFCSRA